MAKKITQALDKWYESQLNKLKTDCRPLLRHTLNEILRYETYQKGIYEIYKDPPDSYHWE